MGKFKQTIWGMLPNSCKMAYTYFKLIYRGDNCIIYGNEPFNKRVKDAISSVRPELLHMEKEYEQMRRKMARGWIKWHAHPSEFLLMDMDKNSDVINDTKLTDFQRDELLLKENGNSYSKFYELADKYNVYKRLKEYFKRDCLLVNKFTDYEVFKNFAITHTRMFVKPLKASYGSGAHMVDYKEEESLKDVFDNLTKSEYIVEELILQDEEMARWNRSSVNTVRIPSVMTKDGPVIIQPFMRAGRAGAIIDNAGGGGIIIPIDENTGELLGIGMRENGECYESHPDSKMDFVGYVPRFKELVEFNKMVHTAMSDHKYLGNDYALTKDGWKLIECNWGQFVGQYVTKEGIKDRFKLLLHS